MAKPDQGKGEIISAPEILSVPVKTEGVPTIYCNIGSVAASYHDVRLYVMEQSPTEVATGPSVPKATGQSVVPRVCLVFTPEFASSLRDALASTVEVYEKTFGPLRPRPDQVIAAQIVKK